ncbi:MAG: hypothetical protein ACOYI4_03720 [Christensenellales bacterium]|jgi:hypothetical protein
MDELNVLDGTQAQVVDEPTETPAESADNAASDDQVVADQSVGQEIETKPEQTPAENAKFAEVRRRYEAEANQARQQAAAAQAEREKLLNAVRMYGFDGEPDAITAELERQAIAMQAEATGVPASQIEAQYAEQRRQQEEFQRLQAQLQATNQELDGYRQEKYERILTDDLQSIKKVYPDVKASDIRELGQDFIRLRAAGVDTLVAYESIRAVDAKTKMTPPPESGTVGAAAPGEKSFYTSDEVDRLTPEQLDNPKIMKAVLDSMTKWK